MDVRFKSRVVVAVLVIYGVYSTVGGLVMLFAPGFLFETIGGFGVRNGHYIFDLASFELPLGLMYLAAIRWPGWRVPTLAFATVHYVLHAISHLIDIGHATPPWVGAFDFIMIAVGLLVHAIAWWFSVDVARATTSGGGPSQHLHGSISVLGGDVAGRVHRRARRRHVLADRL